MRHLATIGLVATCAGTLISGAAEPVRTRKAMVVSQNAVASEVGGGLAVLPAGAPSTRFSLDSLLRKLTKALGV